MSTKYIASNWRLPNQAGVDSYLNDNYGLTFSGTSEYINCGGQSLFNGLTAFSVSCWIKRNGTQQSYAAVLSYQTSTSQYLKLNFNTYTDKIEMAIRPGSTNPVKVISSAGSIPDGEWVHIAVVGDANNLSNLNMYINGVLDNDVTSGNITTLAQSSDIHIGTDAGNPSAREFEGEISEVSIFDYALSSTQISTLYGSSSLGAGNPMALKPAPVAYYPLGDNSASNPLTQPNEAVEDASVFDFDGSNHIEISDSDSLSFGNGSTDSAFSVSTWVNFDDVTNSSLFSKSEASSNREYSVHFGNEKIYFALYSELSNKYIARYYDTDLTSYEGSWVHFVFTYDGSRSVNGLKIYLNNSRIDDNSLTSGTYVAMSNGTASLKLGRSFNTKYLKGKQSNTQIWQAELSASEVSTLYNSGVPLLTGTQPQASNLKAWYKLDQSANWEADSTEAWQIPDAVSAYPQSFNFDGSSDHITLPTITLADDWSVSVWMKHPTLKLRAQAVGTSTGSGFFAYGAQILSGGGDLGKLAYYNGVAYIALSNNRLDDGNWHHWIITYDHSTTTLKCFVDGEENYNDYYNAGTGNTINRISNTFASNYWKGELSNIAIWNSDQSSEALNIYNSGVPAISYTNTPVAWYKLDNTATFSTNWSVPDASGNGNTGTSSGMTEQNLVNNNVSALNGESSGMTSANLVLTDLTRNLPYDSYSFNFDGANDYIDCGNSSPLNINGDLTISAWVYINAHKNYNGVVSKISGTDRNYEILFRSTGKVSFYTQVSGESGNVTTSTTISPINTWTNVIITVESGVTNGTKFYFNGVQDATTGTHTVTANTSNLNIGRRTTGGFEMDGKISNVSLFNEALTSTEVLKLYLNGMPQDLSTFTPAPIAWWTLGSNSFFNGTNFICKDLIGSNDGTSANAGVNALQGNTPRSEANGTGTNQSIPENLVGTTKYSSNNSWSINMSNTARVQDTP